MKPIAFIGAFVDDGHGVAPMRRQRPTSRPQGDMEPRAIPGDEKLMDLPAPASQAEPSKTEVAPGPAPAVVQEKRKARGPMIPVSLMRFFRRRMTIGEAQEMLTHRFESLRPKHEAATKALEEIASEIRDIRTFLEETKALPKDTKI